MANIKIHVNAVEPFAEGRTFGEAFIPFARTKTEREAAGDPRASLEERYGTRAAYAAQIEAAATALVAERLLRPADAAAYVAAAKACERF